MILICSIFTSILEFVAVETVLALRFAKFLINECETLAVNLLFLTIDDASIAEEGTRDFEY